MFPFHKKKNQQHTSSNHLVDNNNNNNNNNNININNNSTTSLSSSSILKDVKESILNPGHLPKTINILLVGQLYQDTILYMDEYPKEDSKIRAKDMEQRRGGNISNTAEVLCQFPRFQPWCMSALGSKESSSSLVQSLEDMGIKTKTCLYRKTPLPSSYIIQSKETGTRTIISHNKTTEITKEEFVRKFEVLNINNATSFSNNTIPFSWAHFEGRNVYNVVEQVDWLDSKASKEGWRSQLTISIEMEKPDREDIDLLLSKGDIMFFSKLFAERRGYSHPNDFLRFIKHQCKPSATLFCTWGEQGATCLLSNGKLIHASALPVHEVVDTVGAGDTFIGGIIFCLSHKLNTLTALKFSCEMASRKVAQKGFDGLVEIMCKLWDASLNAVTLSPPQPKSSSSSSTSTSPLSSSPISPSPVSSDHNNYHLSISSSLSNRTSIASTNSKSPLI